MAVGQFETDVTTSDYLTRRPFTALAPIASYGKIFDSSFAPSDGYD